MQQEYGTELTLALAKIRQHMVELSGWENGYSISGWQMLRNKIFGSVIRKTEETAQKRAVNLSHNCVYPL